MSVIEIIASIYCITHILWMFETYKYNRDVRPSAKSIKQFEDNERATYLLNLKTSSDERVRLREVVQEQYKRIIEMRDDYYSLWLAANVFLKDQNEMTAGDLKSCLNNNSIHTERQHAPSGESEGEG